MEMIELLLNNKDEYWGLVLSRMSGKEDYLEDAMQEIAVALLEAERTFDPNMGAQKKTYAHSCVNQKLLNMKRKIAWEDGKDKKNESWFKNTACGADDESMVFIDRFPAKLQKIAKLVLDPPEEILDMIPNRFEVAGEKCTARDSREVLRAVLAFLGMDTSNDSMRGIRKEIVEQLA
jgi:DNA-directed RNA polymerase specialized sigma24 family protein